MILSNFTISAGLTKTIVAYQSKALPTEKIRPHITSNNSLSSKLKFSNSKGRIGLKQVLKTIEISFYFKKSSKSIYHSITR